MLDAIVIIAGGFVYGNAESVLYAAVTIFVSAQVLDYVVFGMSRGAVIMIFSEKSDEIRHMIINDLNRGVTTLKSQGGYSGEEKNILLYNKGAFHNESFLCQS